MVAPVEPEQLPLPLEPREQVHRPLPHPLQPRQRIARVVHLEINTLVVMPQHELAAVLEVPILDVDERLPKVRHPEQELLLHLLELAALDLPVPRSLVEPEREELVLPTEFLCKEF